MPRHVPPLPARIRAPEPTEIKRKIGMHRYARAHGARRGAPATPVGPAHRAPSPRSRGGPRDVRAAPPRALSQPPAPRPATRGYQTSNRPGRGVRRGGRRRATGHAARAPSACRSARRAGAGRGRAAPPRAAGFCRIAARSAHRGIRVPPPRVARPYPVGATRQPVRPVSTRAGMPRRAPCCHQGHRRARAARRETKGQDPA